MSAYLKDAIRLAVQHHHGQKYGDQTYMDGHIYPVVLQAELIARGAKMAESEVNSIIAIAYMHDLVEDTTVSLDMIEEIDQIPGCVPKAVDALTKRTGESYSDYLKRIHRCGIYACIVKLADSLCNLRASLSTGRAQSVLLYSNNVAFLSTSVSREMDRRKNAV